MLIPFRESILEGKERQIERADLVKAVELVKPSIDSRMVEKYESFTFSG